MPAGWPEPCQQTGGQEKKCGHTGHHFLDITTGGGGGPGTRNFLVLPSERPSPELRAIQTELGARGELGEHWLGGRRNSWPQAPRQDPTPDLWSSCSSRCARQGAVLLSPGGARATRPCSSPPGLPVLSPPGAAGGNHQHVGSLEHQDTWLALAGATSPLEPLTPCPGDRGQTWLGLWCAPSPFLTLRAASECGRINRRQRPRAMPQSSSWAHGNGEPGQWTHLGHSREECLEQGGHCLGTLGHPGTAGHGL